MMDSLRTSGFSVAHGMLYWLDIIPAILMCIMLCFNIYYLYIKTKKIKEK